MSNYKIPYINGVAQEEVPRWRYDDIEWRDNIPFWGMFVIKDRVNSGGHTRNLTVVDSGGKEYTMFIKDFLEIVIKKGVSKNGIIEEGMFRFQKRGTKYGLRMCDEKYS